MSSALVLDVSEVDAFVTQMLSPPQVKTVEVENREVIGAILASYASNAFLADKLAGVLHLEVGIPDLCDTDVPLLQRFVSLFPAVKRFYVYDVMGHADFISAEGVQKLVSQVIEPLLPQLEMLSLYPAAACDCHGGFYGDIVYYTAQAMERTRPANLTNLSICGAICYSSRNMATILQQIGASCPNLRCLYIWNGFLRTIDIPYFISGLQGLPQLRELYIWQDKDDDSNYGRIDAVVEQLRGGLLPNLTLLGFADEEDSKLLSPAIWQAIRRPNNIINRQGHPSIRVKMAAHDPFHGQVN